jgi:hypothetical protein
MFSTPTFNVPNLLTIMRILLVPVFVGLVMDRSYTAATVVFVVAGISDALDGYIAKRFTQRTEFGAWLDPFADKFLLVSAGRGYRRGHSDAQTLRQDRGNSAHHLGEAYYGHADNNRYILAHLAGSARDTFFVTYPSYGLTYGI